VNKVRIKVNRRVVAYRLPRDVVREVEKELTVPNPAYRQNEKMGRRNWKVPKYLRFVTVQENKIFMPIGYLETLQAKLTKLKIRFDLFETKQNRPAKLSFKGKLKDFQLKAAEQLEPHKMGTLIAPTGSGKTVIGLYCIAMRGQRSLVVVHTKELLYQWIERACQFLSVTKQSIGIIGDGKFDIGQKLTIALVQSLYKRTDELCQKFGHVIVDECHRTPSATFSRAISELCAPYQLGLTATHERRDKLTPLIDLYVGPVRHEIPKQLMVDQGHIMQAEYIIRSTHFTSTFDPVFEYSKMLSELTKDEKRNQKICSDVADMVFKDNVCLVLSDRKSHCYLLKNMVYKRHNIYAECLTGDTKKAERKDIVCRVNSNRCKLIIATGQLIGEGFDCKALSVMFIATPIKFSGRVLQYIGRVLRPCKGKDKALVYDYADWDVGTLRRSAHARIKVYGKDNCIWK